MKNSVLNQLDNSKKAIKYWWLLLVSGITIFIAGLLIFFFPLASYISMALLFGFVVLFSGILQIILATSNKHFKSGRTWLIIGGILEIIVGGILVLNLALSAASLPYFLGFWLLFRSFVLIQLGVGMKTLKVSGAGWTIFAAIALLICALIILLQPLFFGVQAVIIWLGISCLIGGISISSFSLQLKDMHK